MKQCWAEGDLRAYHDRELLPEQMERVAAHLVECPICEALADEIAGRAARVSNLMSTLPDPRQLMWMPRRAPTPAFTWPRWSAAAAALAAGLGFAVWMQSRRPEPVAALPPPARVVSVLPTIVPENVPEIAAPVATRRAAAPARAAPPARAAVRRASIAPAQDVFFALDDEPIETGVVMRVALGEAGIPAEVVFGKDGRPRAIRLVSNQSNH